MEDVILNGVSVAELISNRAKIAKEASKYVADGIEKVQALVDTMLKTTDPEVVKQTSEEAYALLESCEVVATTAGIGYSIPWDHDDDTPYSCKLENASDGYFDDIEEEVDEETQTALEHAFNTDIVDKLCGLFESMESTVRGWEASNC